MQQLKTPNQLLVPRQRTAHCFWGGATISPHAGPAPRPEPGLLRAVRAFAGSVLGQQRTPWVRLADLPCYDWFVLRLEGARRLPAGTHRKQDLDLQL
jgi:hypothetical protein